MPKKHTKKRDSFDYVSASKNLKKFGWKLGTKTKGQKAKVKSLWRSKSAYINFLTKDRTVSPIVGIKKVTKAQKKKGGKISIAKTSKLQYRFKFQKLSSLQLKKAKNSKLFSAAQFTPSGIFIERPKGIPAKKYRVSFKGKNVEINSDCRNDEIILIDSNALAIDPTQAIKDAIENRNCRDSKGRLKKIRSYSLMVNGFRAQTSSSLNEKQFVWYLTNKLLPEWLEKNEGENESAFVDTFHVRVIY